MSPNTTELVPVLQNLGISEYSNDANFASISSSADFLPRLMLCGANSALAQEGKVSPGSYALIRSKDQFDDLSKEVPILPLLWRPKAMKIDGENVISVFNPKDAQFTEIAELSNVADSGCMYGPEFLLWVPGVKSFATYFMSSKTARREAPNMKSYLGRPALLKSHLIKAKKYAWHGPVVTVFSGQITWPSADDVQTEATKFNTLPKTPTTEKAPADVRER